MANVYELELPGGRKVELESDVEPTPDMLKQLAHQALPRYTIADATKQAQDAYSKAGSLFGRNQDGTDKALAGVGAFANQFKDAPIGAEIEYDNRKIVKVSDTEYIDPQHEEFAAQVAPIVAAAKIAAGEIPGAGAGATSTGVTARLTTPLRMAPHPGLKVLGYGLPLAAGFIGSILGSKATHAGLEQVAPSIEEDLQNQAREHPNAAVVGSVLANAPFFKVGGLAPTVKEELMRRAVPAAIGSGIQAAQEIGNEQDGSLERILMAGAGNALFNDPTKLGHKLMGSAAPRAIPPTREVPIAKVEPLPGEGAPMVPDVIANDDLAMRLLDRRLASERPPVATVEPEAPWISHLMGEAASSPVAQDPLVAAAIRKAGRSPVVADALGEVGAPEFTPSGKSARESASVLDDALTRRETIEAEAARRNELEATATPEQLARQTELARMEEAMLPRERVAGEVEAQPVGEYAQGVEASKAMAQEQRALGELGAEGKPRVRVPVMPVEGDIPGANQPVATQTPAQPTKPRIRVPVGVSEAPAAQPDPSITKNQAPTVAPQPQAQVQTPVSETILNAPELSDSQKVEMLKIAAKKTEPAAQPQTKEPVRVALDDEDAIADLADQQNQPPQGKVTSGIDPTDIPAHLRNVKELVTRKTPTDTSTAFGDLVAGRPAPKPDAAPAVEFPQPIGEGRLNKETAEVNKAVRDAERKRPRTPREIYEKLKADAEASSPSEKVDIGEPPAQDVPESISNPADGITRFTNAVSQSPAGKLFREVVGTIEDNIKTVSPKVFGVVRERQAYINDLLTQWQVKTLPLSRLARKAFTSEEFEEFSRSVLNGEIDEAKKLAMTKPSGKELVQKIDESREVMEQIHKVMAESRGGEVGYTENYFPRKMSDYNKFRKFLGKDELGAVDAALKRAKESKGRELDDDEVEDVINSLVAGSFRHGGKPGYLSLRTIGEIQRNWTKFYEPFDVAMEQYISRVAYDVANRKFLGKVKADDQPFAGDFGAAIAGEMGRLGENGQSIITENLNALLKHEQAVRSILGKIGNSTRKMQTALYLGDVATGVAQFGDAFSSAQRFGFTSTAKGYAKNIMDVVSGKQRVLDSVGLHEGNVETDVHSRNSSFVGRVTRDVLKVTVGLSDQFNKGGSANALIDHYHGIAKKGGDELRALVSKYKQAFPDRYEGMMEAIKNPEFAANPSKFLMENDDARFFVFNELADMHPLSAAQMSRGYNEAGPMGKAMYGLKSYMIKQLNILRSEAFDKMKNPETRAEGLKFMASYVALVAFAQNVAVSTIRDAMLGRETKNEDLAWSSALGLFGINRYFLYRAKEQGLIAATTEMVLPISGAINDAQKDAGKVRDLVVGRTDAKGQRTVRDLGDLWRQLESSKYIPVVGRELYWRTGKGAEKEKKRAQEELRGKPQEDTGEFLMNLMNPPPLKTQRRQ